MAHKQMPINVLIPSAGAGPCTAVIKALKSQKTLKLKVVSIDKDPLAAGLYLSDKYYLVPASDDPAFMDNVIRICRKEDINIIIPIFEPETPVFAKNAVMFERLNIKVLVNEPGVISIMNDKLKTYDFCLKNSIVAPKIYSPEELKKRKATFPILLKPEMGVGTKGMLKIDNQKELTGFLPLKPGYFAQEFIDGTEYTIDSVSDENGKALAVVPRERIAVRSGQIVKGRTAKDKRLIEYGKEIANKFKNKWVGCSQCKVTKENEIFFIEANPRYGTGISLSIAAGLDIPVIEIKLALNMPIKKEELDFIDNYYMIRYWEEIFRSKQEICDDSC
jgi:carbamoyl-phosphate synthase large subunit